MRRNVRTPAHHAPRTMHHPPPTTHHPPPTTHHPPPTHPRTTHHAPTHPRTTPSEREPNPHAQPSSRVCTVWCGVVWCGVVWCGVVWCGVVWCGVVWCGVVWCGHSQPRFVRVLEAYSDHVKFTPAQKGYMLDALKYALAADPQAAGYKDGVLPYEVRRAHASHGTHRTQSMQGYASHGPRRTEAMPGHASHGPRRAEAMPGHASHRPRRTQAMQGHASHRPRRAEAMPHTVPGLSTAPANSTARANNPLLTVACPLRVVRPSGTPPSHPMGPHCVWYDR
jgi:hypothetical protein